MNPFSMGLVWYEVLKGYQGIDLAQCDSYVRIELSQSLLSGYDTRGSSVSYIV